MRTFTRYEAHNLLFAAMCLKLRVGCPDLHFSTAPPAEPCEGDKIVVVETRDGVPTGSEIHGVVTSVKQDAVPPNPELAATCGKFPPLRTLLERGLAEVRFGQIETHGFVPKPPLDYERLRAEHLALAGHGVL